MRTRQALLFIVALGLLVVLPACDWFAEYTVINETDEELITWPLLHHCDVLVGQNGDYLDEDVVMPHSTLDYFYVGGPFPEPECVQVATKDRRLVLSEPYEYGATYTVREPLEPFTDPIPKEKDLPRKPFTETFMDAPQWTSFMLAVAVGVSAGIIGATFVGTRFLYRRFRTQATATRGAILAAGGLASTAVWLAVLWWWLSVLWVDMPLAP
jgi:hypothetical protein